MKKKLNQGSSGQICDLPKILRIMKLIAVFIFVALMQVSASSYSQTKELTIKGNHVTLEELFEMIENQSEFSFMYNLKQIDLSKKVDVDLKNKTVDVILDKVLKGTDITYTVNNRLVVIHKENSKEDLIEQTEKLAENQQRNVSGKVTDSSGLPLPGVTVVIKGTTNGTVTNFNGEYSLSNISSDAILQFSFVGMKTQEITVNGKASINVVMTEETIGLDEVVAVGYGVQKKTNVTGAISSVKSSDLENQATFNVASALQGKASGVHVMNTSGAPGSSTTIRVRGISSNGDSDPLYIVDGLKVDDLDYLDPENIESIEILKDAASAAIYGAEAGNGVVLVSTKKGKNGDGKLFYNMQYTRSKLQSKMDLLNAEEYITFLKEDGYSESLIDEYYYNDPSCMVNGKLVDTDWQDELYTTGISKRQTVGFQGGTEKASLYIALNYVDNDGILIGSQDVFKRFSNQINASYKIKDWVEVGINNTISRANYKQALENSVTQGSAPSTVLVADPLTPVMYEGGLEGANFLVQDAVEDGYYPFMDEETGNYYGASPILVNYNPIGRLLEYQDISNKKLDVNGTLYANFTPIKNFVFTSRLGYSINALTNKTYIAPYWASGVAYSESPSLSKTQYIRDYYQWENFANYSLELDKNTLSAMVGMSFSESNAETMTTTTSELESLEDNYLYLDYSTTSANDVVSGNHTKTAKIAYYGRFSWNYADKYNLQFNFRADSYDKSKLDLDHNWGYFPSVSGGWTISNEEFFKKNTNAKTISFLKLRASYGKNGSISNLGDYMYSSTLTTGHYYYMVNQLVNGTAPSSYLPNPSLRWEESVQLDLGLDMRFIDNRLNAVADYFNKNTDGLLIESTANLTTGTTTVWQNVGKVNNHGFEFELGWKDKIGSDFSYSIDGNISFISNKVTEYKGEGVRLDGTDVANTDVTVSYFEEGYPVWYLRGYKVQDIDDEDGSVIFVNAPGTDETINDEDKVFIGDGIPDFTYGITLKLQYKGFDLNVIGTGSHGADIMYGATSLTIQNINRPKFMYEDRWTETNTDATRPSAVYQTSSKEYLSSDAMVFDGSFFKIKQIQLGYNFPSRWINKARISALRAYISLDNYFTFTKYPGLDPEVRSGSTYSMAIDEGAYPIARSTMFGLNLTF